MTTKLLPICAALTALCLAAGCAAPTIPGSDEDFELDSKKPKSKGGNDSDDGAFLDDGPSSSGSSDAAPSKAPEPEPEPDDDTSTSTPTGVGESCKNPRKVGSVFGDNPSALSASGTGPQWLMVEVKDALTIGFNVVPMIARFQLGGSTSSSVEIAIMGSCGGPTIASAAGSNEAQVGWSDYPGVDNSKKLLVQIRSTTSRSWVLDVDGGQ